MRAEPADLESSFLNAPDLPLQPASFGNSFSSDDDPHAWAQRLRNIPDKVRCRLLAVLRVHVPVLSKKHCRTLFRCARWGW